MIVRLKWRFVAVMVMCCLLSGCNKSKEWEEGEAEDNTNIVRLNAITIGQEPKQGMDELYKQLDALTIPELNCILRFEFIPWGNERKQINIAVNSGDYDFIPGGVFSDYRILAAKNAFLDLNQYLDIVPNLVKHYGQKGDHVLKNCEINGNLYGIPQLLLEGLYTNVSEGFFFREDLRKEWGIDPNTDMKSMEAYLYRAKQEECYANEPLITDNRIWTSLWFMIAGDKYLDISSILENPFVVVAVDNPYVPILRMETPEFKEVLEYLKKWYEDGILASNLLVSSDNEGMLGLELMKEDKKPCETNAPIWSCNTNYIPQLYEINPDWEFGFFNYTLDQSNIYTAAGGGESVICISSKTLHPETAIRLLEKLHTDVRYYNLLAYGVEGIHYNRVGENINYNGIEEENRFSGWTAAGDGYLLSTVESINRVWSTNTYNPYLKQVEELVKKSPVCPIDAFTVDTSSLDDTLHSIESVKNKYFQPLLCGDIENIDQDLEEAIEQLKRAGIEAYLERLEEELQQYKKNKVNHK